MSPSKMSRYVDIKKLKLTNTDKEIFVMRLAQGRTFTKKWIWKCVKREVIERGYQDTSANSLNMYDKFKTCIPTHSMRRKNGRIFMMDAARLWKFFKYTGWLQMI